MKVQRYQDIIILRNVSEYLKKNNLWSNMGLNCESRHIFFLNLKLALVQEINEVQVQEKP